MSPDVFHKLFKPQSKGKWLKVALCIIKFRNNVAFFKRIEVIVARKIPERNQTHKETHPLLGSINSTKCAQSTAFRVLGMILWDE